jgi:hypothetical protein
MERFDALATIFIVCFQCPVARFRNRGRPAKRRNQNVKVPREIRIHRAIERMRIARYRGASRDVNNRAARRTLTESMRSEMRNDPRDDSNSYSTGVNVVEMARARCSTMDPSSSS